MGGPRGSGIAPRVRVRTKRSRRKSRSGTAVRSQSLCQRSDSGGTHRSGFEHARIVEPEDQKGLETALIELAETDEQHMRQLTAWLERLDGWVRELSQEQVRRWNQPVPLIDIVRASLSEVEQYERVGLRVQGDVSVIGPVVNDLDGVADRRRVLVDAALAQEELIEALQHRQAPVRRAGLGVVMAGGEVGVDIAFRHAQQVEDGKLNRGQRNPEGNSAIPEIEIVD